MRRKVQVDALFARGERCGRTFTAYQRVSTLVCCGRRRGGSPRCGLHFVINGRHLHVCAGLGGARRYGVLLGRLRSCASRLGSSSLRRRLLVARTGCCRAFNVASGDLRYCGVLFRGHSANGSRGKVSRYCGSVLKCTRRGGGTPLTVTVEGLCAS